MSNLEKVGGYRQTPEEASEEAHLLHICEPAHCVPEMLRDILLTGLLSTANIERAKSNRVCR